MPGQPPHGPRGPFDPRDSEYDDVQDVPQDEDHLDDEHLDDELPQDDDAFAEGPEDTAAHRAGAGGRRHDPAVYRRRRLVVGAAALVLLVLIVLLIVWLVQLLSGGGRPTTSGPQTTPASVSASPSGSTPASASPSASGSATESPSASETPSESATASESAPAAAACQPADLSLTAATDRSEYAAGESPVLEMRIQNVGDDPCEANLGTSQQVFTVTSGSDRIFSSTDCQVQGQDAHIRLEPGTEEVSRLTWDRTRSQVGCTPVEATPGNGAYRLEVRLGSLTGEPAGFTLR